MVVDAKRAYTGFALSTDSAAYFQDATVTTFRHIIYGLQTLVADAVLVSTSGDRSRLNALADYATYRPTEITLCGGRDGLSLLLS